MLATRAARFGSVLSAVTRTTSVWPIGLADTGGAEPSRLRTSARTSWLSRTWMSVARARAGSIRAPVLASKGDSDCLGWSNSWALAPYTGSCTNELTSTRPTSTPTVRSTIPLRRLSAPR